MTSRHACCWYIFPDDIFPVWWEYGVIIIIIIMNEFHCDANRLPRRLQGRCHVVTMYSDVRRHTIVGTVLSSVLFWIAAETTTTWSTTADCSRPSQLRRGRPGRQMSCVLTVERVVAPSTQNAADWCRQLAVTRQRDIAALYSSSSGKLGRRDGARSAAALEASGAHEDAETHARFSGPSRRVERQHWELTGVYSAAAQGDRPSSSSRSRVASVSRDVLF